MNAPEQATQSPPSVIHPPTLAEQIVQWWDEKRAALAAERRRHAQRRPRPTDGAMWAVWAIDAGKEGI